MSKSKGAEPPLTVNPVLRGRSGYQAEVGEIGDAGEEVPESVGAVQQEKLVAGDTESGADVPRFMPSNVAHPVGEQESDMSGFLSFLQVIGATIPMDGGVVGSGGREERHRARGAPQKEDLESLQILSEQRNGVGIGNIDGEGGWGSLATARCERHDDGAPMNLGARGRGGESGGGQREEGKCVESGATATMEALLDIGRLYVRMRGVREGKLPNTARFRVARDALCAVFEDGEVNVPMVGNVAGGRGNEGEGTGMVDEDVCGIGAGS
ncbi:hypothetical protein CYLTODRAFT_459588 [Cylindrobasidium torrendii FP15055 ss-10]|uniref:Uncharacterized protein n=1 Tax=Cylindrobasidium torrendii FP15055 ss-10 TaxID=1314674 RepID=A0A0D7AU86_9AGAR|nr:hypothetical protein CYLTODRAFT_459588 [Cylindrobasidium torrendii FP15055 ss-10]